MNNDRIKFIINTGVIGGLTHFAFYVTSYFLGFNPSGNFSWIFVFVPITMYYLGIKEYRNRFMNGYIPYGNAFRSGMAIGAIYASFFAILVYLFITMVPNNIFDMYMEEAMKGLEQAKEAGLVEEDTLDLAISKINEISLKDLALGEFQTKVIGGLILSLIMAGILKKEQPLFDSNPKDEQP